MQSYRLTNKAVDDLVEIWDYTIENWSEEQAKNYYKDLTLSFEMLASNPKLGRKYIEISDEIYGFVCHRHIVFYRKESENCIDINKDTSWQNGYTSKGY